ncbi:MAG: molecular chaperone, partial [Spirochaetota bacterium]
MRSRLVPRSVVRLLAGPLLLIACTVSVHAFSFEPISQDYETTGPRASHVFRVTNTTSERIAVQISVRPRRIELDGTEIQGKEADEFVVFPRQMLLDPGDRRSVRVRWSGPADIESEQAYRIIAEQVPVNLGEEAPTQGGAIRLTYRYEGSLYVIPPGATPNVVIESVEQVVRDEARFLRLVIANQGNRHRLLSDPTIVLADEPGGTTLAELGADDLPGLAGENMLAGSRREFIVPAPEALPAGPVYGQIEFDAEYAMQRLHRIVAILVLWLLVSGQICAQERSLIPVPVYLDSRYLGEIDVAAGPADEVTLVPGELIGLVADRVVERVVIDATRLFPGDRRVAPAELAPLGFSATFDWDELALIVEIPPPIRRPERISLTGSPPVPVGTAIAPADLSVIANLDLWSRYSYESRLFELAFTPELAASIYSVVLEAEGGLRLGAEPLFFNYARVSRDLPILGYRAQAGDLTWRATELSGV